MAQNIDLNNVTVVAANNTNTNKEENTMNNTIIAVTVEELKAMTVKKLRMTAQQAGCIGYSKMKKDDLIAMLTPMCDATKKVEIVAYPVNPLDDPEVQALDVSDDALLAPVAEETVTENVKVVEEKEEVNMKLMNAIAKEIMFQTLPSKNGKLIIKKDEKGDLVLLKYALFYRATKTKADGYLVVCSRLWGVVSKVIGEVEGEDQKTFEKIQNTIDTMVSLDMVTRVASERTYATLTPTEMSQDEKDQLNDLWKTKDIKTEKLEDGRIKTTALTEKGKEVLNQLYPNWSYKATADQMNKLYAMSK